MGDKKNPGRFTLHFNLEDPQQRMVSELLEQQGRHKAQFITSAVQLYIQYPKPKANDAGPPVIDEAALEQMLLSIMEKNPRFATTVPGDSSKAESRPPQAALTEKPWEGTIGDDAMRAIADTLAAFQTG